MRLLTVALLLLLAGCVYPVPQKKVWVHPEGNPRGFLTQANTCMQATQTDKQFEACMMDEGWEQLLITGKTVRRITPLITPRPKRNALAEACKPGILICRPGSCACYHNLR